MLPGAVKALPHRTGYVKAIIAAVAIALVTGVPGAAHAQAPGPATSVRAIAADEPVQTPSVAISPTTVSLASGTTQRFTAKVAGTANQKITWSATGGTVTSDGTFTAGTTTGQFMVTATITGGTISASAKVTVTAPIASTTSYLSDRPWASMVSGWGPAEYDRSNGEEAAGDGGVMTLNGVTYTKGIGAHSVSDIRYSLGGACSSFSAVVGVDDEVGALGSVVFQVWTDGVKRYDSGTLTGSSASKSVAVDVTGASQLSLVVTDAGDNFEYDHADWADARIACGGASPPSTSTPTGVPIFPGEDIQAKVNAAAAGTAFVIKAGVHRLQQIRPKDGNTFAGEPGAILSGARLLTSFTRSGSYWVAGGQTQQGVVHGDCQPGWPRCNYAEELFIDDQRLRHVDSLSAVTAGTWFFDYAGDRIYFADDPTGRRVETSVTTTAFEPTAKNVTVSGLVIEKYASLAQYGAINLEGTTGWVVSNNDLRWNHGGAIRTGTLAKIIGNKVRYNGQIGIVGAGDDLLVENNEIAYNNAAHFESGWEAGGTKFVFTNRLIVRGNFVHHNDGPGLWTDIDNINTLYENNVSEDNQRMGIFHEISYAAVIRNNTVRRNGFGMPDWAWGAGILVAASPDVEIYGNLVEGNADGITAIQQYRGSGAYGPHEISNLWVHDNNTTTQGWSGFVQDLGDNSYFTSRNNRFDRNRYQLGVGAYNFVWLNAPRNETEWRSFGLDVNGTFVH
jgi:hypothetical protein